MCIEVINGMADTIAELEEKLAEREWIPCSERLPSKDGHYLVCMAWDYDNINVLQWAEGWNCYRRFYDGKLEKGNEIDKAKIIAWMPLPKPYKDGDVK